VVFLHGIATDSYLWRRAAPAVAAERHVVAPDVPGHGNPSTDDSFARSIRGR
jgi:pimeloyl-ACP methyl ester carboxylesterase